MFIEKFNALKGLYVYVVYEWSVVRVLVKVANIQDGWIEGVSDDGIYIISQVSDVRDDERGAADILQSLIESTRDDLDAAEQRIN